jgi:hypothetical protein
MSLMMDETEQLRISARIYGVGVYERALQAARAELKKLLRRRQAIDRRTKSLQRFTGTILAICEEGGIELPSDLVLPSDEDVLLSTSLIDAVRAVLKQDRSFMTVAEVRDGILGMELDLHKQWNPTALVRETLKRLLERGEVSGAPEDKAVRYKWPDSAGEVEEETRNSVVSPDSKVPLPPRNEETEKPLRARRASKHTNKLALFRAFLRSEAS